MAHQTDIEVGEFVARPSVFLPNMRECKLAVGVLLIIVLVISGLLYLLLIKPQQTLNEQMKDLGYRYQNALNMQSRREALELQLQHWQTVLDSNDSLLLKENNDSLAAAALQERVKSIVSLHAPNNQGCRIQQQKNFPPEEESGFIKVGINVVLTCRLEPLQAVLYDLETENPLLILNNLIIRSSQIKSGFADLHAQFDISGYILNSEYQAGAQ